MAGSLRMYALAKTPNFEIMDDTTTGGPALPTLAELNRPISTKAEWVWSGKRSLLFLPNGEFVAKVKLYQHLKPSLADPASTASDVYIVSRPEIVADNPLGSLQHWSFYTQGIFYHLSAPDLPRNATGKSHNATKSRDVRCRLKREDLSNINSEDYTNARNRSSRKLLLAYKVGQTDYRPEQILQVAEWAVHQLSAYGILSANCQHFATTMVRRTAMRVCDRSAFAGTALQIVDWDLGRGSQPHVNCVERGFVVSPPLPINSSILSSFIWTCCWLFKLRGYIEPIRIRRLYEKGPRGIGAWHPPGYHAKEFKAIMEWLSASMTEFKDDLRRRRWKDALYGRYQELPDGTLRRPLQVPRKYRRHDGELMPVNVQAQRIRVHELDD